MAIDGNGNILSRFVKGVVDVLSDAKDEFVKDVTGGDIDPKKNARALRYTGKGVTVEHTDNGTDRTQGKKQENPSKTFLKSLEGGCQDIDKYVAIYMRSINPKNREEAANAISAIMPAVSSNFRQNASDINLAFDNYLANNFPIK